MLCKIFNCIKKDKDDFNPAEEYAGHPYECNYITLGLAYFEIKEIVCKSKEFH